MQRYITERVGFESGASRCVGVLNRPVGTAGPVPCVVMAHDFSGTMDWIVPDFAGTFADGGLTVLIFDYRFLGVSGGEPRQLIDTKRQRSDLRRAVQFARAAQGIDARRIALWGTSLGGSHVVNLAADDSDIAAVVAYVPALDLYLKGTRGRYVPAHMRLSKKAIAFAVLRLFAAASVDAARDRRIVAALHPGVWPPRARGFQRPCAG